MDNFDYNDAYNVNSTYASHTPSYWWGVSASALVATILLLAWILLLLCGFYLWKLLRPRRKQTTLPTSPCTALENAAMESAPPPPPPYESDTTTTPAAPLASTMTTTRPSLVPWIGAWVAAFGILLCTLLLYSLGLTHLQYAATDVTSAIDSTNGNDTNAPATAATAASSLDLATDWILEPWYDVVETTSRFLVAAVDGTAHGCGVVASPCSYDGFTATVNRGTKHERFVPVAPILGVAASTPHHDTDTVARLWHLDCSGVHYIHGGDYRQYNRGRYVCRQPR
jgi:hypothetical protein